MTLRRSTIDRLVAWSPVLLLAGLAALTYWLNAQVQPPAEHGDGALRHDPDMYITNFHALSYDVEGHVRQSLSGKQAQHYPDDGSVDLVLPSLTVTDPGKPRMSISADAGTVSGDRDTVTLRGNVRAVQDGASVTQGTPPGPTIVTTDMLRVTPKLSRAETDRPVTIEDPRGIIHGVGMIFDNQAHTVRLNSAVRGTLQPRALTK
jgi:lipopolysaccharide export system protein LptC